MMVIGRWRMSKVRVWCECALVYMCFSHEFGVRVECEVGGSHHEVSHSPRPRRAWCCKNSTCAMARGGSSGEHSTGWMMRATDWAGEAT